MFKEENFNQIAEETKLITLPSKRWNLNQIVCNMKTDAKEIQVYFDKNILLSIKQMPEVYSYWS